MHEQESINRNRIDEELGELEKEKMMRELEVKELVAHHRAELRNLEIQMSALKDNESDLLGRIDQLSREREERDGSGGEKNREEVDKLEKQLREEKLKKDQAISKLAEMMMRKDLQVREDVKKIISLTERAWLHPIFLVVPFCQLKSKKNID